MDMASIQAAMTSLGIAADLTKNFVDIKSTTEAQSKVMEIQGALLEAQSSAFKAMTDLQELHEENKQLKEALAGFSQWGDEKQRYALVNPWYGPAQAYALKKSCSDGEPPHLLCTNCFHNSKRVILNPTKKDGWKVFNCPVCKASISTGYREVGSAQFAEEYNKDP